MPDPKTIAAIATPIGRGAIGIVRMSGGDVLEILGKLWKSGARSVDKFATHRLYLGNIVDLSTGRPIDKVFACLMRGPDSYTGEDVVEISCHGGAQVLKSILDQVLAAGARMAEPGEFTKRAFLNGKMDLAQAEAVAALIDSKSALSARLAEEQLEGKLSDTIVDLRERLKKLLAFIEAAIDFPEEDIELIKDAGIQGQLAGVRAEVEGLIKSYDQGRVYREGVKTVIAGPPNAGKSSLLNSILGMERAIVHHVPGTTRDTIEEDVLLDGISFRFIDTAGLREAEEEVEEIGVARSKKEVSSAEMVVLVVDGHDFIPVEPRFVDELAAVRHVIIAVNKKDLGISITSEKLKGLFGDRPIVEISAKTGEGVGELCSGLAPEILGRSGLDETTGLMIISRRHFDSLNRVRDNLGHAQDTIKKGESAEFIAVYLRQALDSLGEIIGEVTTDDILDEIFRSFCIGK